MKTVIFLGAGASAAAGAPPQKKLFQEYFESTKGLEIADPPGRYTFEDMVRELRQFFTAMFYFDPVSPPGGAAATLFPTFEEALGLCDLAEIRRESFKGYGPGRMRLIQQYLVLAMTYTIYEGSHDEHGKGLHAALLKNLLGAGLLRDTTFITTNYDLLIDKAIRNEGGIDAGIKKEGRWTRSSKKWHRINYGLDVNPAVNSSTGWVPPDTLAVRLFKLHGSTNWLYCPACNALGVTRGRGIVKGIKKGATKRVSVVCDLCESTIMPVIVPPTFYKDMSRVFLGAVWNKAENALREAGHVIFSGYSCPDADIHIKYLLKRAQTNRPGKKPQRLTVLNSHEGKADKREEEERFKRFLGPQVDYVRDGGFADLADAPGKYY